MGCLFSIFGFIFKIIKTIFKVVILAVVNILTFLVKIGLLFPLIYAAAGLGLILSGSDIMVKGSDGFLIYHIGFCLLTLFCIVRSIKKAIERHNEKYDENGKRIK